MRARGLRRGVWSRLPRGDGGSGGLWVLWVACLAWVVALSAVLLGGAVVARHRAAAAADLAALAVAERASQGELPACRAAVGVAAAMGAHVHRCALRGLVSDVSVTVRVRLPSGALASTRVRARAGPAAGPSVPLRVTSP